MDIKEVEKLLDCPRANIRFYEKEGLISPSRKSNNYRDYSDEDISELKKILVLRKLGFTVQEISDMQKGGTFAFRCRFGKYSKIRADDRRAERVFGAFTAIGKRKYCLWSS